MTIRIEGLVGRELSLGPEDLAALPGQVEDVSVLVAGRNGRAVRLASLLDRAGVTADAGYLTVEADGEAFAASVLLDAVREAVIVYSLNGAALPKEKGGPFRLLIPDAARCGSAEVDKCANVKNVGVLRLDAGHGHDTRPTTKSDHIALHRKNAGK